MCMDRWTYLMKLIGAFHIYVNTCNYERWLQDWKDHKYAKQQLPHVKL